MIDTMSTLEKAIAIAAGARYACDAGRDQRPRLELGGNRQISAIEYVLCAKYSIYLG